MSSEKMKILPWIRWRSSPDGSDIEATRSLVKRD